MGKIFVLMLIYYVSTLCSSAGEGPFPDSPPETDTVDWAAVLSVKNVDDFFERNVKKSIAYDPITGKTPDGKAFLELQQQNVKDSASGLVLKAVKEVSPESHDFSHWRMVTINNPSIPADWQAYNYLSFWVYMEGAESASFNVLFELEENFYAGGSEQRPFVFTEKNIEACKWTRIFLNFSHIPEEKRFHIKNYRFYVYTIGKEPDSPSSDTKIYMDNFQLLKIKPRQWSSWEPDPQLITINQLGYPRFASKLGYMNIGSVHDEEEFKLLDVHENKIVFAGKVKLKSSGRCAYAEADFSKYTKAGRYRMICGNLKSYEFHIGDDLYENILKASFDFIAGTRSGTSTSLHGMSHLDDGTFKGKHYDFAGGYYDACDVRRYGGNSCIVAESCLNAIEFGALPPRLSRYILEEARWACLSHHKILSAINIIPRAMQEEEKFPELNKNNCFSDNVKGSSDDRAFSNEAPCSADVHWLYGKSAAQLAVLLQERKSYDAADALKRAEWAWDLFTSPEYWRKNKIGGIAGPHVTSLKTQTALYLYRATGNKKYLDQALSGGKELLAIQNHIPYPGMPTAISGNFTWGNDYHSAILHKERPLAALADLYEFLPQSDDRAKYREAMEFAVRSMILPIDRYCQPYSVPFVFFPPPGNSIENKERDIGRGGNYLMRPMFNYAYAQARIAQVLKSYELEDIVLRELGWCFGVNPFAVSFVWETGTECQRQCHALHGVPEGTIFGGAVTGADGIPFYLRDDKTIGCIGIEVHIPRQARFLQTLALVAGPGVVEGTISEESRQWHGEIKIFTGDNEFIRAWQVGEDGRFGPLRLYPGNYKLCVNGENIPFQVVTNTRQFVNITLTLLK